MPAVWAEYSLKLAGEDPQGYLTSEAVTVYVPVGDGATAEEQEAAVRAQLDAVDDVARPLVREYLADRLEQAGIRPAGERPSPGQVAYIVDLARQRQLSRRGLARIVQEAAGVEVSFSPQAGAEEIAQVLSGNLSRLQASRVLERLKAA